MQGMDQRELQDALEFDSRSQDQQLGPWLADRFVEIAGLVEPFDGVEAFDA